MSRIKLKYGGKSRHKALLGADGAISAAATLAAANITAAATAAAAKTQAKAVVENAKTQAASIKQQSDNNTALQKESIAFTRQQNQENRDQQQDIQTTLQIMAGQENTNNRMERSKMQVKLGGKPKRINTATPFYGGTQFKITDGGGVIPIQTDNQGYGLYELFGNDHNHYHKTSTGKNKTGVGIKFKDGSVVEGEGNQNTNQGELLYVTPNDAIFISKHTIDGFNPAEAVKQGVHPIQAFAIQEALKDKEGLNDDGSKTKRRSIKRAFGGMNNVINTANITQNPTNGTRAIAGGVMYGINNKIPPFSNKSNTNNNLAKYGSRIRLKCGGRKKAKWGDYAGATYNAAGNVLGAGVNVLGSMLGANALNKAYTKAGAILADAYSQMHGIDLSEIDRKDYDAPQTLAVVRGANTNINPQLERIRRNSSAERNEINRGTLSSAARQQRLAATNDRMFQRMGEQYAYKDNADEQIRQGNAERITQTAQANADREAQANRDYANQRLSLLQYNNSIENAKIAGMAQARADALTQSSLANAQGLQASVSAIGSGLTSSAQGFASAYDAARKEKTDFTNTYVGLGDKDQVKAAILRYEQTGDKSFIKGLLESSTISPEDRVRLNIIILNDKKNKKNNIKIAPGNILPDYISNTDNGVYYG